MAFWDLDGSRQSGMSLGRIPFGEIDRYAARYPVGEFRRFHALIKAADEAYLEAAKEDGNRAQGKA